MWIKKQKQLENAFCKSKPLIHICKICFRDIKENFLLALFNKEVTICHRCLEKLEPKFSTFKNGNLKGIYLYDYDDEIKELLYQVKGCFDYELSPVFLSPFLHELKLMFHNYYLVCAPSSDQDNEIRGFNHVSSIFAPLGLKEIKLLRKKEKYKQSDQHFDDREKIKEIITLSDTKNLTGKNILLVDDVLTTGNTLHACYELIKSLNPKKIKILVLAKTIGKQ